MTIAKFLELINVERKHKSHFKQNKTIKYVLKLIN